MELTIFVPDFLFLFGTLASVFNLLEVPFLDPWLEIQNPPNLKSKDEYIATVQRNKNCVFLWLCA